MTSADTNYSTSISPYLDGAWPYLLRGLNWARAHGVRCIVDVHGAPGSQNGYDNSGQRTDNPQFVSGGDNENVQRTLDLVRFLAENIGGMVDVLELLNEVHGPDGDAPVEVMSLCLSVGDFDVEVGVGVEEEQGRGRRKGKKKKAGESKEERVATRVKSNFAAERSLKRTSTFQRPSLLHSHLHYHLLVRTLLAPFALIAGSFI